MLIIDWLQFLENGLPVEQKLSSMTVGVFDGVHRGHKALIERVVSHNLNYMPVVITFKQNHKTNECTADIQSFEQKLAMFESLGIKITVVIDFTESFSRMAGIEFLKILAKRGNIGFFAVGSGFRCGFQLDTGAAEIENFFVSQNVSVEIVPEIMEDSIAISSSRIRIAIANGDLKLAEAMLGWRI